jgi:hypothetical protein
VTTAQYIGLLKKKNEEEEEQSQLFVYDRKQKVFAAFHLLNFFAIMMT